MTNQQAINVLKDLERCLDDYCELNDEGKAAFSKAITALELFGNTEQLPSAQPDLSEYSDKLWRNAYERGKREAQPERKWIPCSERLPEEEQTVLVTCSDGQVYIYDRLKAHDYKYDDMYFWEDNMGCYQPREDVNAWMPLPAPYGGEQE